MAMNATELFQAGKLNDAIVRLQEELKQHPLDAGRRVFLGELLCFAGELERADQQFETVAKMDVKTAMSVLLNRQLIRAEQARRQFFDEGRVPEFLQEPTPALRLQLEASVHWREGDVAKAAQLLAQAEEARPKLKVQLADRSVEDFRDLDDRTASFFEVLTSTGKYYWIPFEHVERVEFVAPQRAGDLLWRRASMSVRGGPDGEVYLPVLYAGSAKNSDDAIRLGRATEWLGEAGEPVQGQGQRVYLAGDEDAALLELTVIEFQS
jgi:type VI secretion system protein ImpE